MNFLNTRFATHLNSGKRRLSYHLCPPRTQVNNSKNIYLTFDDGPDPHFTPEIASLLQSRGHRATFFCIGRCALAHKGLVSEIKCAGHSIGSHSSKHIRQWENSSPAVLADYRTGHKQVESVLGTETKLFRPPYGHHDLRSSKFCKEIGTNLILWNCDSLDWQISATADSVVENIEPALKPGAIVLLHDAIYDTPAAKDRSHTAEAVSRILDIMETKELQGSGLEP